MLRRILSVSDRLASIFRSTAAPAVARTLALEPLETRLCLSSSLPRGAGSIDPRLNHAAGAAEPNGEISDLPRGIMSERAALGTVLDLGAGLVAFLTSEAAQKRDLNGDGDRIDDVLQSFNAATGVVTNSGQQAIAGTLLDLGGGLVAFLTDEAQQQRRLNPDRDRVDEVLQVFNALTGEVRNSFQQAIADSMLDIGGGRVAFLTSELAQKQRLNGDGDRVDEVLQVFDAVANVVRNSFMQAVASSITDLGGGLLTFLSNELAQSRDLNGDGDRRDNVLQAFNAITGIVTNSGTQAIAGTVVDIGAGRVAFLSDEAEQDRRLNDDGDKVDSVLHTFNAATGAVQNTGQALA